MKESLAFKLTLCLQQQSQVIAGWLAGRQDQVRALYFRNQKQHFSACSSGRNASPFLCFLALPAYAAAAWAKHATQRNPTQRKLWLTVCWGSEMFECLVQFWSRMNTICHTNRAQHRLLYSLFVQYFCFPHCASSIIHTAPTNTQWLTLLKANKV